MSQIRKVTIKGFKSIKSLKEFRLHPLNVLIGSNGSGKSNFIGFFNLLRAIINQELEFYVNKKGGSDSFLYLGRKITPKLESEIYFDRNGYIFSLTPTQDNVFIFEEETFYFDGPYHGVSKYQIGKGNRESNAKKILSDKSGSKSNVAQFVVPAIQNWVVYHFHDTSDSSPIKRRGSISDNIKLHSDGCNLAAFLLKLKNESSKHYEIIVRTIQLIAPYFDDFILRPVSGDSKNIELEWKAKGNEFVFTGDSLSDGTLRFICLSTVLLQPTPPATILIDEPELGLHPYAISILASMIRSASSNTQLILSTQSVTLVNEFSPDSVIVVDNSNGSSTFTRLNNDDLKSWLESYSVGDLWQKNVFGGRPQSD